MRQKLNYKQRIWVCTILLLIIVSSVCFVLFTNEEMQYNNNNDDIWGSNMDLLIGIVFVLPYFFSLTVLLHCGYICFKSTPFSGYRRWYYIAIALSILTVLAFWGIAIYPDLTNSHVPLMIYERTYAISFFTSCTGFVFDLIGTNKYRKLQ